MNAAFLSFLLTIMFDKYPNSYTLLDVENILVFYTIRRNFLWLATPMQDFPLLLDA